MRHVLKNSSPSTLLIKFFEPTDYFELRDSRGRLYYYRYLPNGTNEIKINLPDKGLYYFNNDCQIEDKPLQIIDGIYYVKLPKQERHREKEVTIRHNPNQTGSPAIIYTDEGIIVTGTKFLDLPIPMRIFVLLHEKGHFKYSTEKYCDLYAFVEFVKMGYNPSTAIYCLSDVLRQSPMKDERVYSLFQTMIDAEIIK